jgi:hypothetical protein
VLFVRFDMVSIMAHFRLFAAILSFVASSSAFGQQIEGSTTNAEAGPQLDSVLSTEQRQFADFNLAPIVVPQGEEVGDLIDPNTTSMIARSEDCFPKLKPRKQASLLPSIITHSERGIAAELGVGGVASASGDARENESYILEFTDVEVAKVSRVQLRESLRKGVPECDEVRPFIEAATQRAIPTKLVTKGSQRVADVSKSIAIQEGSVVSYKPPPLLLGTVFTARRVIRIENSRVLDANAKLSLAQQFIEKLGLGSTFKASAGGDSKATEAIVIEGKEAVPVAFAPAFIVKSTKLANGTTRYDVAAVDPEQIEVAAALAKSHQDQSLATVEKKIGDSEAKLDTCSLQDACGRRHFISLEKRDWKYKLVGKADLTASVLLLSKSDTYRATVSPTESSDSENDSEEGGD